jgi:LPXTG-motif cell wall-anchored protein
VSGPLFPSVGLYCGQVAFYGKSSIHDSGNTPISAGFEDKISISLVHSTNVPKVPSLDYYIVTLEWMQKIYVKFFDGTAIPYGADAYKHMTLPFFSIFQPQLFQDEDGNSGAPDPEMFNSQPEQLWSLFFRAFLFAALFEGFDAYIKERDALYQKQYLAQNPKGESRNINQIRPRSTLETRYESAMKSGLLFVHSMDFDDVKENGLYDQNNRELSVLFRKCDIRLDNMGADPGTAIEKILLLLWGKILHLYNQNKNDLYPTEENLESKLQQSLDIITNHEAELQARVKGVWEAYILFNLPKLEFPQTQTSLKEFVRLAKTNLVFYLDKEPIKFALPVVEQSQPAVDVVDTEVNNTTPQPVMKEGTATETDNTLYLGLAAVGAVLLGGGFYFFMKKKET